MAGGKPAGVRCVQLADDNRCLIFGKPERPAFCGGLQPSAEMCGESREHAMHWLDALERATGRKRRRGYFFRLRGSLKSGACSES